MEREGIESVGSGDDRETECSSDEFTERGREETGKREGELRFDLGVGVGEGEKY